jgi:2-isopropylmalate synthase
VKLDVGGERFMTVGEGNGPVNALDGALRAALTPVYPTLEEMRLVDYKVRILTPEAGTKAVTRVMIESADGKPHGAGGRRWATIGVSANVIDASYAALHDAITWKLFHDRAAA